MIPQVTIGAAVLMAALIVATLTGRWYATPVRRHRRGGAR